MKHYQEESKELTKPLTDFFSAATHCRIIEKNISQAKINDLTHDDLNLKFCTKENMDFNSDEDGRILYWKTSDLKTQFITMQDLLSRLNEYNKLPEKYFCYPLPSINFHEQPILMIPKIKLNSQTNQLRFFINNICFSFKKDMGTFNDLLKKKLVTADSILTHIGEFAGVAAKINTPFISQDEFLPIMRQHIVRLFNGAKEMAFVSLVEKARHILFNILMEKNKNSPNPDIALEQKFKNDKNEIYKRAERKGLIRSAGPLMEFQKIRDELRHPSTLDDLVLPDNNYIIDVFDDMISRLSGKEIHLLLGDETTTLPKGWEKVDQVDFLTDNMIDSMCLANNCIKTVDITNRLVEEITTKQAEAKQKIQRKKQIQRLVTMGIISPDQRQSLENTILQRNNISHGHASGEEVRDLGDKTNEMTDLFNYLLVKSRI